MSTPTVESVVCSNPDVLGGTPVFAGTRVPLENLVDYLAAGDPLERFLAASNRLESLEPLAKPYSMPSTT